MDIRCRRAYEVTAAEHDSGTLSFKPTCDNRDNVVVLAEWLGEITHG